MAGEGSALAAIKSLRSNRSLLKKRSFFDKKKDSGNSKKSDGLKDHKNATPAQLQEIRLQMQLDKKIARKKKIRNSIIAFVCTIVFFWGAIQILRMVFEF